LKQKLTLGFSPCPNDTFIFDALVNGKIDTGDFEFEVVLEDVQTLNNWAREGKLDISKISYGVLPHLLGQYAVLKSGGALGKGVGPLLISKEPLSFEASDLDALRDKVGQIPIAIPGEHTTAHFLFSQAFPNAANKTFVRFDDIEDFVLSGKGLGVIIHENRFTYQLKGLHKWMDLGSYWEETTSFPIPLGGIVIRKSLDSSVQQQIDSLIRQSLEYSFARYPELTDYIRMHSQEMSEEVMRQHINLYVNDFSLDMGESGRAAIEKLLETLKPGSRMALSIVK
jgi:1,4-dihydroxy-6-naphthoate synthase